MKGIEYKRPDWLPEPTAWDELPIEQKAEMISVGVRNGLHSMDDIRLACNRSVAGEDVYGEGGVVHPSVIKAEAEEFGRFLANGGKLEHRYDGTSEDTQYINKVRQRYYDYTRPDHPLTQNVEFREVVITPDSKLSPEERNYRERLRQKNLADYAEQKAREYTANQVTNARKEWENSVQKKVLDYGIEAAQGVGMASDITGALFGGIPAYSGIKGALALDRAVHTGEPMDYVDAGIWLSPMLTVAGKNIYDAAKPVVTGVFREGTPAAEWARTSTMSASDKSPMSVSKVYAGMLQNNPLLSEYDSRSIAQYANASKNPVEQIHGRMANSRYSEIIRNNGNPELRPQGDIEYLENINPLKPETTKEAITKTESWWGTHSTPYDGIPMKDAILDELSYGIFRNPFTVPPAPYVYMPEEKWLLTGPFIKRPAVTESGKRTQYNILKSHETAHHYSVPNENSPIADMFSPDHYLVRNNGAEVLSRGSQLKDYYNKKMLNEKELKYAADHYVEDTGIDNEMTMLFDAIKERAKTDPAIWRKMAVWMSKKSPVVSVPIFMKEEE